MDKRTKRYFDQWQLNPAVRQYMLPTGYALLVSLSLGLIEAGVKIIGGSLGLVISVLGLLATVTIVLIVRRQADLRWIAAWVVAISIAGSVSSLASRVYGGDLPWLYRLALWSLLSILVYGCWRLLRWLSWPLPR